MSRKNSLRQTSIVSSFSIIPDPRKDRNQIYSVFDLITIAILAILCGIAISLHHPTTLNHFWLGGLFRRLPIRSVASSFLACLEHLKDTETPFSIKDWVQKSEEGSWLFISCKPSQRSALNPLLSSWFSIATRSLLQLEQDINRRVWFVVDELPTLQKLKELESFVTESRKYGGCGLFALQSPAQLEEIYGRSVTQTIIGNCATRMGVLFIERLMTIVCTLRQNAKNVFTHLAEIFAAYCSGCPPPTPAL